MSGKTKSKAPHKPNSRIASSHILNKETREAIEKALRGEDVYGPFETYEEMMAFLKA